MLFGKSFLPTNPSRWTITSGSMTSSEIALDPDGYAVTSLIETDIKSIPSALKLTILADRYTDRYAPTDFVEFSIITVNAERLNILIPIIDIKNSTFSTVINFSETEYTEFKVSIRSKSGIKITSWELSEPIGEDTTQIINELRGELPRLLRDYNEMPYLIGQEETTVCLISAFLVKNTDLNGHLQVSYRATEDCQVIMRAKDNDVTELFSPVVIDIKAGRGSLDIPHAYVEKFIGYHTFTCTLQVTNGTLKIPTRAVLYTVDGGHLAERVMDVGMDVRDIVMRRVVTDNDPSYIYAIGVDDGIVTVKARPYNEVANTAWEPRLLVGEGKEAAITFNGDWAQDEKGWRLNTDSDPWVFWVDAENILWTQYFDDETTKIQLATDVVDVSVVMGWRNPVFIEQDQGVIAAYVKADGTVWYRNYCVLESGPKVWEPERQITQYNGVAKTVFVFRTNDYRVGIRIQDTSGAATVLLTERNWAGMALKQEVIAVTAKAEVVFTEVTYRKAFKDEHLEVSATAEVAMLFGRTDNTIVSLENLSMTRLNEEEEEYQDWGFKINVTLNFPTETNPSVTLIDATTLSAFVISSIDMISDTEFNLNIDDIVHEFGFNGVEGHLQVTITGMTNEAGYDYDTIVQEFMPSNLVPPFIPLPEVEVIWNE